MDVHIVQRGSRTPITVLFRSVHCTLSKIIMIICKIIRKNYDILGRKQNKLLAPEYSRFARRILIMVTAQRIYFVILCISCILFRVYIVWFLVYFPRWSNMQNYALHNKPLRPVLAAA